MRAKKTKQNIGKVYFVGAGPGDPGLITLLGLKRLLEADAVVYDRLVNSSLLRLNKSADYIYAGKNIHRKEKGREEGYVNQSRINNMLLRLSKKYQKVVRLKGGDPFIFGRGGEELSFLKQHKIPFEVIPGVSSGSAAAAYAGIPVTDRRYASSVTFVTGHETDSKSKTGVNWSALAKLSGTLVVFMSLKNLARVTELLKMGGRKPSTPASVIQWGTFPNQKVIEGTLKTIARKARASGMCSPALTVIGDVNKLRPELKWFEKKPLFGKKVLITRARRGSRRLKNVLEERGAEVLEVPLIEIKPPKKKEPLKRAIQKINETDWVIFTSAHGVESFFEALMSQRKDARALSGVRFACAGRQTAEKLADFGVRADFIPKKFTAEALFKEMTQKYKVKGQALLMPRSDLAPPYIKEAFRKKGARVTDIVAYHTVRPAGLKQSLKALVKQEKIDYVLFTSSSTVRHFFDTLPRTLPKSFKPRWVSIGPVTSRTLREYGKRPYREAPEHTLRGLAEVITNGKK